MRHNLQKSNNFSFYTIIILTFVIFIFGIIRDIDLNGDNSDDKLTLYVYAVSQNVDKFSKIEIAKSVKESSYKKCSSQYRCVNRLEMQINQNNNYPLISFLINFFDKTLKNDDGSLIKISKAIHYGLLTSQIIFFSIFLIFAFYSSEAIKASLIIFLLFIVVIDSKILNINLLGFFPFWDKIASTTTEHLPRAIALFSGILAFILFYMKKFKECAVFVVIPFFYHLTFGIVVLILLSLFYFFDKIIQNISFTQNKINNFFFTLLLFLTIICNKLSFLLLLLPCFLVCKNIKNFRNNNMIISFLLSIMSLISIFTFENLLNKIAISNQHYIYISTVINYFNSSYLINLFDYTNIKNFNDSYFMYYLRHAPTRFYPLLLPSLIIILILENQDFIKKIIINIRKKYFSDIKSFKIIFVITLFCFSPVISDRIIYIGYVFKSIPNDLVIGMKREGTYSYLENKNNLSTKEQSIELVDFRNKEILSFYILSQLYKNSR
jgi:hypothetical protein